MYPVIATAPVNLVPGLFPGPLSEPPVWRPRPTRFTFRRRRPGDAPGQALLPFADLPLPTPGDVVLGEALLAAAGVASFLTLSCPDAGYCSVVALAGGRVERQTGASPAEALGTLARALGAEPRAEGAPEHGRLLMRLLARAGTVTVSPPGAERWAVAGVEWITHEGERGGCVRLRLLDALREAAGEQEPRRYCPRCGCEKGLSEFPRDRSRPSGLFPWCSPCNRAHVREHERRKRAARAG